MDRKKISKNGPEIGLVQWFQFQDYKKVESAVRDLQELKIKHLRTLFSWADWEREGGPEWFDWFVPKLAESGVELLPSLFYTPVTEAQKDKEGNAKVSYPPMHIERYAEFVETMIRRYGQYFQWVQLWNEPNWKVYWDDESDPDFAIFSEMTKQAAIASHKLGKKNALGGLMPYEAPFLTRLHEHGALQYLDAICLHNALSWTPRGRWYGWQTQIQNVKAILRGYACDAEVWIAETGVSTYSQDPEEHRAQEQQQIDFFKTLKDIPAERVYLIFLYDQAEGHLTDDAINMGWQPDPISYHYGIKTAEGRAKPLFEYWKSHSSG